MYAVLEQLYTKMHNHSANPPNYKGVRDTVGEMFSTQTIAVNHPAVIGVFPDGGISVLSPVFPLP